MHSVSHNTVVGVCSAPCAVAVKQSSSSSSSSSSKGKRRVREGEEKGKRRRRRVVDVATQSGLGELQKTRQTTANYIHTRVANGNDKTQKTQKTWITR